MGIQNFIRLGVIGILISSVNALPQTAAGRSAVSNQSASQVASQSDYLGNLQFRNLGPAVAGGRITAVVGVPSHPEIYYAGSAAGGVFKSEDGATTWRYISSQ